MCILTSPHLSAGPKAIVALLGTLLIGGCDRAPPAPEEPAKQDVTSQSVAYLPFDAGAFAGLADDIDGNGLVDVALTSHDKSFTQVFFQRTPRQFEAGPRIEAVGFHPGQLLQLPGAEHRYIMLSEGIDRVQVMAPREDGGFDVVATANSPKPRVGTALQWPDTGLALAVAPYGDNAIYLFQGFDPATAEVASADRLPYLPKITTVKSVVAVDINGDGIDEILFANPERGSVSLVRHPQEGKPLQIEDLWRFDRDRRVGLVVPSDLDQDGDMDLILPDEVEGQSDRVTSVNVLANDGSGAFAHRKIPFPGRSRLDGGMTGIRALASATDKDTHAYVLAGGYEQLALMRFRPGGDLEQPELRSVSLSKRATFSGALLRDLDGDGWLDAIITRLSNDHGALIIYGPLWEQFGALTAEDLVVRQ